ncbi:hypothetical protein Q4Q35_00995 [Flavivirga aquimarina]|uniref:Secretion system C-terminal sorting domain-containing protein n=1 Tax=Flavivirga aquimarina TaxID=2027862 RepID=A0ABT8W5I1_9FLAO|nr:hypothetical protein [Flavivirga aquimarina]MDO5968372.1 hypothetical protein [Flavivirga aquimarina]
MSWYTAYSQDSTCDNDLEKAKNLLAENSPFDDSAVIFKLVEPCALNGNSAAENLLGVLYLKGIGTPVDEATAFKYISSGAEKGHATAQYNLGRMYKTGAGCAINFNKAIDWFKKSSTNGNQRATYSLGYMYYKGLGVEQNYQQAIQWFKNSEDPMAKHFLGLCYYQGYGVPADENKALEILLTNTIINSKTLVSYIQNNQKENTDTAVEEALNDISNNNTNLEAAITTPIETLQEQEPVTVEDVIGDWEGKLIQYDWSGNKIERILPIELSFKGSDKSMDVNYSILEQQDTIIASFQDDYLYFKTPFNFTLDKLYSSNPKELSLDYGVLSINLKKQVISNSIYLIGTVDTYIDNWMEYGQPTRIILKPKHEADNSEDEALLLALAAQEDQFIKLYPVPFVNQLTVQYQLEMVANVYVELVSINGGNPIVVVPTTHQDPGNYTYAVPVNPSLPEGLYVVRLFAGNQLYTRLIIKDN